MDNWRRELRQRLSARLAANRQRRADRAASRLRKLIGRGVGISEQTIEAVVERDRNKVVEILARTDPVFFERALTFSQEGEDLILARMLVGHTRSFFVDVGAHHPFRFSNTFLLYKAGWRGINIDATPGSMRAFEQYRPEDTNIECFVGNPAAEKTFTRYNEPALNTASAEVLESRALPSSVYWPVGTSLVRPRSLSSILDAHKPDGIPITLLNIDVEGSEQEVLESNDWSRYRPQIILIEQLSTDIDESLAHPTTRFLSERGYRLVAKAFNSSFFALKESP
jgi:FkbM family methyltransferase